MLANGAGVLLRVENNRNSEIHVHETAHVMGMDHLAGSWPPEQKTYRGCGLELSYQTFHYPNCNYNHLGAWYAPHCPLYLVLTWTRGTTEKSYEESSTVGLTNKTKC